MKATIRTFQSGCGDCIFLILEEEKSGESFHIMIDCGIFGPLEKVCGYRSTIKILFCPFIKLNNG